MSHWNWSRENNADPGQPARFWSEQDQIDKLISEMQKNTQVQNLKTS